MRSLAFLAAGLACAAPAAAQSRWQASLHAGHAASTDAQVAWPGGGGATVTGFVGREVGGVLVLGLDGGFANSEHTDVQTAVSCLPPSAPGAIECTQTDRIRASWWHVGPALRVGAREGTWRPWGAAGVGAYFGDREFTRRVVDAAGIDEPGSPVVNDATRTALGGSLGAGLELAPGGGAWSIGVAARVHGLVGGDQQGEYGGDVFTTLTGGLAWRF